MRTVRQALSVAFCDLAVSAMLSHGEMKTIDTIRLHNFLLLLKEVGEERGQHSRLSALTGVPEALISQIRNRVLMPSGRPREVGDVTARKLERGMDKPEGWMDRDHEGADTMQEADWLDLIRGLTPEQRAALMATAQAFKKN